MSHAEETDDTSGDEWQPSPSAPSGPAGSRGYHRSVSVGTSPGWEGRLIRLRRRRNPSSGEPGRTEGAAGPASFLGRPSARLQQLRSTLSLTGGQADLQVRPQAAAQYRCCRRLTFWMHVG